VVGLFYKQIIVLYIEQWIKAPPFVGVGPNRARHSGRGRRRHDPELIEIVSSFCTSNRVTDTPEGVSAIKPGEIILARIEEQDAMSVAVAART
jgi:hypothetical protein